MLWNRHKEDEISDQYRQFSTRLKEVTNGDLNEKLEHSDPKDLIELFLIDSKYSWFEVSNSFKKKSLISFPPYFPGGRLIECITIKEISVSLGLLSKLGEEWKVTPSIRLSFIFIMDIT